MLESPPGGCRRTEGGNEEARFRLANLSSLVILAVAVTLADCLPVSAQRSLVVEAFDVTLNVGGDGRMDVLESIRYRFNGGWNGVLRDIPIVYRTPNGFEHRLELDRIRATKPDGSEYRYELSREGRNQRVKVWVPAAVDATHTVEFRYRVVNPLLFFEGEGEGFGQGYDELYWNVTGVDSDIPVLSASATLFLPDGLTGVRTRVYTGPLGSQASDATISEVAGGYRFVTLNRLAPRHGLTIDVAWNQGVVARPGIIEKVARLIRYNWVLVLPIISFLVMWRRWKYLGRDPSAKPISTRYEPPEGMIAAEVGTLVDNRPDLRDLTASIVDLAVRGFIRIEERESGGIFGLGKSRDYIFHLRRLEKEEKANLSLFERELLLSLHDCSTRRKVRTEDLDTEFFKALPRLRTMLFDQMVKAGHYQRRPDVVVRRYWIPALVLAVTTLASLLVAAANGLLGTGTTAVWIGGVGAVIPPLIFAPLMSRRTVSGTRKLEHILGFKEFLARVEKDRMERTVDSPEMFERYLPYAMALGVERRWARAFEGMYSEPPRWYSGSHMGSFSASDLARGLDVMADRTERVMASKPRPESSGSGGGSDWGSSSFSGGFSGGGGSSGGGFGGGGTGGF